MFCIHNCILLFQVFHKEHLQRAVSKATTSAKKYSLICILLWLHALHNTTLWIYTRQYMHVSIIQLYVNLLHYSSRNMHARTRAQTHTHPHTPTPSHTHTHTPMPTHTHTHKHTHTRTHTYANTHTQTLDLGPWKRSHPMDDVLIEEFT